METILQILVFIVLSVALALFGVVHVRRRIPLEVQMEQNEVAGFFIAVLGVVYGVLLAFAVIVVWEEFEESRTVAEREANSIGDLYRMAEALPDAARIPIQDAATTYARILIEDEWKQLAHGRESVAALTQMDTIWSRVRTFQPNGAREEAIFDKMLDEVQDINDDRRMRLLASRGGIPRLIWGVLIGGGVVTVLFTYFFGLKHFRAQMAMTAMYVISIGFVLFLIAAVQHPFSGAVYVSPEAMELVLQRIELLEAARR